LCNSVLSVILLKLKWKWNGWQNWNENQQLLFSNFITQNILHCVSKTYKVCSSKAQTNRS